jgi:hypothetical protein
VYLVHQKKNGRNYEVAWMWLPHFLAADVALVKSVDKALTEEFAGKEIHPVAVHEKVLDLIEKKYPIPGLRTYLQAIETVQP